MYVPCKVNEQHLLTAPQPGFAICCIIIHCVLIMQEMAWESEKKRLAVAKLRKYFLDDLEVEHIVLHAFRYIISDPVAKGSVTLLPAKYGNDDMLGKILYHSVQHAVVS